MEDNENINDHIRKSLEGYRLEPKISSFDEIRKKMEKKKRRKFLFFIFPGFAALLVLGGLLIYNAYTPVSPSAEFVSQRLKNHSSKQKDLIHVKKVEDPGTPQTKILPDKKSTEPDKPEQEIKTPKPAMALLPNDSKPAISGNSDSQEHTADVSPVENYIPEEADRLDLKFLFLPEIETAPELISDEQNISDLVVKDSVKKEKPLQFFIGGAFSPQANRYQFLENKNGVGSEGPFAGNYLNTKKDKNAIRFSYGFGLKIHGRSLQGLVFKGTVRRKRCTWLRCLLQQYLP